jgi:small subunit ribosomal protein S20
MQRHKSAEKEARKNIKHNAANREARSRLKTAVRNVLESKDSAKASDTLKTAYSIIDKSVKTGLIHANKAANNKSRLTKFVGKIAKPAKPA